MALRQFRFVHAAVQSHLNVAFDDGQEIIKIVRDAAGEPASRSRRKSLLKKFAKPSIAPFP
jgi:hypothetical protein